MTTASSTRSTPQHIESALSKYPRRRVILLGASNLTRCFPTIVSTALATWREPIEIMAAMGHGRSFGQDSSVLGRKISGIFPCALWQDLQNRIALPTAALITDVGNDLLYGTPPSELVDWVERCVNRLQDVEATIVITQMPIASVERLSPARFHFFRQMLFPRSRLTLDEAKTLAHACNERLIRLGETRKIPVIPVSAAWYGFDPIHVKRRLARRVWPELLATWNDASSPLQVARCAPWRVAYLASRTPWEQSLFGIPRRTAQPCGRFSDGTTISLY